MIAIGYDALKANTTANYNIAIGKEAMFANTTGTQNTAVGFGALAANTTQTGNTAFGYSVLGASNGAVQNVGVGYGALVAITTGNNNVAVGYNALAAATTATPNVAIGVSSLANCNGGENVAVGPSTMVSAGAGAFYNTAIGSTAGYDITTGDYNVLAGRYAGTTITTGGFNICIGASSKPSAADASSQIVMGYNVTGSGDNTFTFGSSGTDTTCSMGGTTWSNPSDERIKEEIEDEVVGLSFINDLRPRTFRYRQEKDIPEELDAHAEDSEKRYKTDKYEHGFIAQEVKQAIDKHDFKDGFDMWSEDLSDGRQRVGSTAVIPMLIKAIQELSAEVEKLKGA